MTDPFVQRMMARTQARRQVLAKLIDPDKENCNQYQRSASLANTASVNSKYPGTDLDEEMKCVQGVGSKQVFQEKSFQTQTSHQPPSSAASYHSSALSSHLSTNSSSPTKSRFQVLAQRSKELNEWEDDYTYHSVSGGSANEVETRGFNLHDRTVSSTQARCAQSPSLSYSTNEMVSELHANQNQTPNKYYFGECPKMTPTKELHNNLLNGQEVSSSFEFHTPLNRPNGSFSSEQSSNLSYYSLPQSDLKRVLPSPSLPIFQHTPSIRPSKSGTPTKCLVWDRQLLESLEAQGFTPSASKSKLAYDFKDSLSKESSASNNLHSREHNSRKTLKDSPKILSVLSKSNLGHNPEKDSEFLLNRERSESPGKVSNLRNQWEQHIRNASPEREIQHSRSPSPLRKASKSTPISSQSCSPQKTTAHSINGSNHSSKSSGLIAEAVPSLATTSLNCFTHESSSRNSVRSLSPHKPPRCGEVIKGEAPMPEATAVVKNPTASVKERAAAFSLLSGPCSTIKDPTELSLKDRKKLFEKHKGTALVPKAPFGHCVSDKTLQSSSAQHVSQSYEAPRISKSTCNTAHKTFHAPQSSFNKPSGGKSVSDFASNVVEARKKKFEYIEDNWEANDINLKVKNERKIEMDQLANRFRKPRGNANPPVSHSAFQEAESDTEYPESEESNGDSEVSGQYPPSIPVGPPKPPRTGAFQVSASESIVNGPHSPSKRLNSTELDEFYPHSPSKEYVPKIKPGCLFPSLSDIDSHSEAVESDEDNRDSSFAESILTYASGESLGVRIQATAQSINKAATRQLSTIKEGPLSTSHDQMSKSLSPTSDDAIGAIDDALEEAFDDTEPTPPKRSRKDLDNDKKTTYKTPKVWNESESSSDSSVNLAHSISMYRRQKPAEIISTPVRQIMRRPEMCSPSKDSPISPSVTISSRIKELQEEEEHQLIVISQASSAITVVSQHPEQHGTPQHVEAEKLLLVSTQKRQSCLHEIQRLKAEGALGQRNFCSQDEDSCRGSISISKITLPLKQDFLHKSRNESNIHHFLVLVKHRDQVITSQLQATPECIVEGAITFPNLMSLHNLSSEFNISLEVYEFKVEPLRPSGFKKEHSRLKLTPLKRLHKESKMAHSPAVSSPGGPYSVRSSSFQLIGFAHLNINTLTRNAWTLEKVPFNSPMNGHLLMRVAVAMEGGGSERSFLTMFDDVGGFGAWNRRWCVLGGPFIRYWSYPDDENRKECLGCLDLRMCMTRKVEQVSRDICTRQFTFQLTFVRPLRPGDKSDLIHEVRDNTLITRILISADSKEEKILWCNKLNKALANVRAWDPDSLKPEDYHV